MNSIEATARRILADNGVVGEPHPALLEDTMREVEYHGAEMPETPEAPEYTVEKQEWEMPCDHYACDLMHRHLYNASYEGPRSIDVYDINGDYHSTRTETRFHMKKMVQWAVVDRDGFAVESFDTKREALAHLPG